MANVYDVVRYPNWPVPETHPATLGAFAALVGRSFAPFRACRVLEIGCGEGVNLMSMALGAPASEFVGIDLAEAPIAQGRATAQASGLANVTLRAQDIMQAGVVPGEFDYVVAHGVYAWVPAPVRAALMRLVGRCLRSDGLAFISYNAFPGCRMREVLRDLLLDGTRGLDDPGEKLSAARAVLIRQIEFWSEADPLQKALIDEARDMLKRPPEVLFHDELGAIYEPQYLRDVIEAARAENLEYLGDAKTDLSTEAWFPSAKFAVAEPDSLGDWGRFEQLMDFASMRRFRRSIFCRAGKDIDRHLVPHRLSRLWANAEIELLAPEADRPRTFVFRAGNGAEIETRDSYFADFLTRLGAAFPSSIPVDDIESHPNLAEPLLRLFVARIVSFITEPLRFSLIPGEHPIASPLAPVQAAQGETVLASLRHKPVRIDDATSRTFITLMDGSRTRAALATEMAKQTGVAEEAAAARMPQALAEMAKFGLMMK
ncbi:MAG TPA: class I SAM-dependent methyltransferase [Methylocella sp.]